MKEDMMRNDALAINKDDDSKSDKSSNENDQILGTEEVMTWSTEKHMFTRNPITKSINSTKSNLTKDNLASFR